MFTDRVEQLLKQKGIQKKVFLHDLGLAVGSFSNWKKRQTVPGGNTLQKIADYLGVTVGELLGDAPPGMDDFTYAMQAECAELTDEDKQILLGLARRLAERRRHG